MMRVGATAILLLAAGCGGPRDRHEPSVASPEVTERKSLWRQQLRRHAVHHGDVARRELYTWTRPDQIAQLRRDRRLLTRYRGEQGQVAAFDLRLQRAQRDPLAELLSSDAMKYRRFAWVSPWPIRRGWGERDYGDRLIRVVLAEEAWIGVLDSRGGGDDGGWRFLDLSGRSVAPDDVLAEPSRLGAVYHVWHLDDGADLGGEPHAFREYVLCNEAMIERWEVASNAIAERLDRDRTAMRQLAAHLRRRGSPAPMALGSWARRVDDLRWPVPVDSDENDARALYESNLALLSEPYLPSPDNVDQIARALMRSTNAGPPLVVVRQPEAR